MERGLFPFTAKQTDGVNGGDGKAVSFLLQQGSLFRSFLTLLIGG